jgi:hypothetical protein
MSTYYLDKIIPSYRFKMELIQLVQKTGIGIEAILNKAKAAHYLINKLDLSGRQSII